MRNFSTFKQTHNKDKSWFQLALDFRAGGDWVSVLVWFQAVSSEIQHSSSLETSQQIATPSQSRVQEQYPDDTILSYPVANFSTKPANLEVLIKMTFDERDWALGRCIRFGSESMFHYCYRYFPGGYYHDFSEIFTFTEQQKHHAVSLPLANKQTTFKHNSDMNVTGIVILRTVQIHSENFVHIYKEGFTNEPTTCRKEHYCYNYSAHYTRLKQQKPRNYYAFYHHKIEHMSLFTSTKLYKTDAMFKIGPYVEDIAMRLTENIWLSGMEEQRLLIEKASRRKLANGQWKGNWVEASKLCKSVAGYLPILASKAEQDELMALLKFSYGIQPPYPLLFIGLVQQKVGESLSLIFIFIIDPIAEHCLHLHVIPPTSSGQWLCFWE